VAYLLAVFCFVLLLFTVFICVHVFLFFATTSLVNKDLYIWRQELPNSAEMTQNSGHYAVQGHTRSTISVPIENPYATS